MAGVWIVNRITATLTQVRIGEKAVVPDGEFGEKVYDQIRVIEPGRYRVYRQEGAERKRCKGNFPYPSSFRPVRRYSRSLSLLSLGRISR